MKRTKLTRTDSPMVVELDAATVVDSLVTEGWDLVRVFDGGVELSRGNASMVVEEYNVVGEKES